MNKSKNTSLHVVIENGLACVTLDCPERHNAFDDQVISELSDAFDGIADNDSVGVSKDTRDVLENLLGYNSTNVDKLEADGTVFCDDKAAQAILKQAQSS